MPWWPDGLSLLETLTMMKRFALMMALSLAPSAHAEDVAEAGRVWVRTFPIGGHQFTEALVTALTAAKRPMIVCSVAHGDIAVVDAAATLPVFRPLIGSDKQEIITEARALGFLREARAAGIDVPSAAKTKQAPSEAIYLNIDADEDSETMLSWKGLVEKGRKLLAEGNREFLDAQILTDEMSVLLFTSGTTGLSKGVMLSQRNLVTDLMIAPTVLKVHDWDIFFSVLPIHHTYECTCGFLMPLYKGAAIAYCEGLKHITDRKSNV